MCKIFLLLGFLMMTEVLAVRGQVTDSLRRSSAHYMSRYLATDTLMAGRVGEMHDAYKESMKRIETGISLNI